MLGFSENIANIYQLAILIPSIAVGVRRMHDVNKSGWFLLIPIYNFILAITDGTKGNNTYGPDPKGSGEMQEQSKTGVEVKTGFFPLAFFLFFCTPTIVLDGTAHRKPWGIHSFALAPGRHTMKIFFRYLFMAECGANSIDVIVEEGKMKRIAYSMSPWMFAKGSLKEL